MNGWLLRHPVTVIDTGEQRAAECLALSCGEGISIEEREGFCQLREPVVLVGH